MVAIPSLVALGIFSLSGWRWWKNRGKTRRTSGSVDNAATRPSILSAQPSPSISEDSGVVDGTQVCEKSSEESLAVNSKPSRVSQESTNKPHWKYPTASSDVECETMSEVDSICSSEEVFSESQHFETSSFTPGIAKTKTVGVSKSAECMGERDRDAAAGIALSPRDQLQKSVSTPNLGTISWPNRKRVMVKHKQTIYNAYLLVSFT